LARFRRNVADPDHVKTGIPVPLSAKWPSEISAPLMLGIIMGQCAFSKYPFPYFRMNMRIFVGAHHAMLARPSLQNQHPLLSGGNSY
jgi:hypothetical protein